MTKAQEKLVMFMEGKSERLKEVGITKPSYFTEKDAEALLKLSDKEAGRIWGQLKKNIEMGHDGLVVKVCPFCLQFECESCPYGENHLVCGDKESDYESIYRKIYIWEILNTEFYKNLIERIEKGGEMTKAVITRATEHGLYSIRYYRDGEFQGAEFVEEIELDKTEYIRGYRDGVKATIELMEKMKCG